MRAHGITFRAAMPWFVDKDVFRKYAKTLRRKDGAFLVGTMEDCKTVTLTSARKLLALTK